MEPPGAPGTLMRALISAILLTASSLTPQWPGFRGPDGQGHASESGLPIDWSETKNVVWKSATPGSGWSSPVVAGGRVWLTAAIGSRDVSLRLLAFDVATGRQVLDVEAFSLRRPGPINPKNSYASPTPVVDADRIYVHFGAQGTAAISLTGEIVWKTRFVYESQHGAGGSPMLFDDLLILSCDGSDDAFVVALDKRTGKVRWRTPRRFPADQAYSTPLAIRAGDRDAVVSVGAYRAGAYDARSGREIWRVSYADGFSNVPRPVFGHGLVFIATGFQEPSLIAVHPDGSGDVTRTHIAWTLKRGAPLTPSPVLVGDELYLVTDGGIATAVDAKSGAVIWQQRLGGTFSASPIFADGRIYFLSEQGVATIVAPGREFRSLGTPRLDGATLASMAVAERSIFVRTDSHLYRIASAQ